ncbi:MAG: tyrosine-type recombinase/integrase [Flavobacteriales bacterium]|nr:tyrosine-type recombinase/integrase [Flavobacteriales bacterium]
MIRATSVIYLDEKRPKKNGQCSVKIKVTYNRKRKYYSTGIELYSDEFEKATKGQRRTFDQKQLENEMLAFQSKANNVIKVLPIFTFDRFEEMYFEQRNASNSVSFAFDKYIEDLKEEDRIGTAVSYECAKNSLEAYQKNLSFAEVTPKLLKKYEANMLKNNKSISTVGIYLRSLRAVYNLQKIDSSIYPFGQGKDKYTIPTGKNIKKALTIEEISKIFNFKTTPNSIKEMAKDYWLFLYLCNGMNVKDFCLLKWENIDGNMLSYKRAKTKRSQKESKLISVALKKETLDIIKKWGQPSLVKGSYIFPHLKKEMNAEKERATYQQLTKIINKYIKKIATEVGIDKNVTTYFARHSFATVLKRSGAKTEMISELLGHSSMSVTESYLDSFENEQIQEQTDVLTEGFNKAN